MYKTIIASLLLGALTVVQVSAADFNHTNTTATFTRPSPILPQPGNGFGQPSMFTPSQQFEPQFESRQGGVVNNYYYDIDVWNIDQSVNDSFNQQQQNNQLNRFDPTQHRFANPTGGWTFNPQMFNVWHQRPFNETFNWYMANVIGNPFPFQSTQQMLDLNGDGMADIVYTVQVGTVTFTSTWISTQMGFRVMNELW